MSGKKLSSADRATYPLMCSQSSVFASDTALLKALYLATGTATKKWTQPLRNWSSVYGEFQIMYGERTPQ